MVKKMLRSFLELRVMSWSRLGIFVWEATRERRRLRRAAGMLGLPVLDSKAFHELRNRKPDATTAFILGTGASAADLSDQKLAYIESQFSIGVNQWILHPTVPDVYSYEVDPDIRLLQALDRPEVREQAPYLLFLKPSRPEDFSNASHLPQFMRSRSLMYSRVNIWTRRESNIGRDFKSITKLGSWLTKYDVLLDNGASIARMISLCVLLGFREIVLVGVDLNHVEYFWHRKPEYLKRLTIESFGTAQKGLTHETLRASNRPFAIDQYVVEMSSGLREMFHLSVESRFSLLAQNLSVWVLDAGAARGAPNDGWR